MSGPGPHFPVSEAERQRIEQIDRLFALGSAALPDLMAGLGDPSWSVRRAVVGGLAALGDDAVGLLLANLVSPRGDETVLAALVEALVLSTGAVEPAIAALADHPDPAVAADVAQVLGRRRKPTAVPPLIRLAAHANDNVAVAAIEALGRVGSRAAVEALLATVRSGNFFRVFPAIDVLGRTGDPRVVQPLAALLADRHFALEAARALGRTGDKAAVAPLAGRLTAGSVGDVRVAAQALVHLSQEYGSRYGLNTPVQELLRRSVNPQAAGRRLVQAAEGADPGEQAAICTVLGLLGDDETVRFLVPLVTAADPVGAAASRAMQELGRASEEMVLGALAAAPGESRKALLALVTSPGSLQAVTACLTDSDPEVRAAASEALARIANPAAVGALFERLADSSPLVVQSAVAAIQSLGGNETRSLAIAGATAPSAAVRRWSLRILSYFGYAGVLEVLLRAVSDSDPRVQESAIQGLALMDDPSAKDALLNAARHSSAQVRAVGLRSLGQSIADVRVEAALIRGLADPEPWPRYYACQAAGKLRVEAAVETLVRLLSDDPAGQVRVAAVEALSHFEGPLAEAALVERASSPEDELRQAALIGLGIARIGMPAVVAAVAAPDPATRLVAVSALASFEAPEVTDLLFRAGTDDDPSVRTAAIGALAARPGIPATAALIKLLDNERTNQPLVRQILSLPDPGRIAGLVETLGRADDELAPQLTAALARMHDGRATAALVELLASGSEPARKAAAATLGAMAIPEVLAPLHAAATRDPSAEVRRICAAVLSVG